MATPSLCTTTAGRPTATGTAATAVTPAAQVTRPWASPPEPCCSRR
uniref:Uncharacterized protein n=1 Tax=Macrostomum lignano TaxID=282301 RepID=A0A1I8GYQ7_9PLAT